MVDIRRSFSLVLLMIIVCMSAVSGMSIVTKHQAIIPAKALVYQTSVAFPPILENGYILTNSATGSTCPSGSYSKHAGLGYAFAAVPVSSTSSGCERGYFEFNTALIPSGAHVTEVVLHLKLYSTSSCPPTDFRGFSGDPASTTDAGSIWSMIGTGTLYVTKDNNAACEAYPAINLGPVAAQDLTAVAGVVGGHFGIGFKLSDESRTGSFSVGYNTAQASSESARPYLQITYYTESVSPNTGSVYVAYRSTSGNYALQSAKYKEWYPQTDTFSPEVELSNLGSDIQYVKVLKNPISQTTVVLAVSAGGILELYSCASTCGVQANWHDEGMVAQLPAVSAPYKYFDAIFEEDSSDNDLMIVYEKPSISTNDFYYRTWTGGSFSSEAGFAYSGSSPRTELIPYFKLAVKPATDQLSLIVQDNTLNQAWVMTYDDNTNLWGNTYLMSNIGSATGHESVAIAYEHYDGAIVALAQGRAPGGPAASTVWARFNGTAWSSHPLTINSGGSNGYQTAVPDPDPNSNKVMFTWMEVNEVSIVPVFFVSSLQEDGGVGGAEHRYQISNGNNMNAIDNRVFSFTYNPSNSNGTLYYEYSPTTCSSNFPSCNIATSTFDQSSGFLGSTTIVQYTNPWSWIKAVNNGISRSTEPIKQVVLDQFRNGPKHPILFTYLDFNSNQNTYVPMTRVAGGPITNDTGDSNGEYFDVIFDPSYPVAGNGGSGPPPPPPPPGSVTIPIILNTVSGSDTPQTAGVAFTVTCAGGGGTHNGNPASQNFVCNPNTTVTVTTPTDTSTSHFRFSDGSTLREFISCTTSICAPQIYSIRRQFSLTITPVGMDPTTQAQAAIIRNGVPAFPFFPGSAASTQFVDENSIANVTDQTVVVANQERFKSYNSTIQRTITMSSAQTKSYMFVHEFDVTFRTLEQSEGSVLSIVPAATFTSTITSANGTSFPVSMSVQDGLHAFDSSTATWVKNGTQTFGPVYWRSLQIHPTGITCTVVTYHTCDVLSFSKYFGMPNFSYMRMGTANATIVLGNVTYDNPNNILRFNSTSSGTQETKLEFLITDHTGVSRVLVNSVPVNWTLGQLTNTNIMILDVPNIGFSGMNQFEVDFGDKNLATNNIVVPPGATGTIWTYNLTRNFDTPFANESTIDFSFLSSSLPYNATVLIADSWLTSEMTYTEYFGCPPPAIEPCKGVINANSSTLVERQFPNSQTIFFFVYDDKGIVRITASSPGQTHSAITGFESISIFGLPVLALFPILIAVIGPKSLAPIFMPITAAVIGLMSFYGMLSLPQIAGGVIGLIAAMGILLGLRR